ncbi:MAG: glycosyltransferase [Timaviella obliquedivisa GSE-PSE-MK23-08B]|jgi:glycosyltransferase involved in cell wall biosynthesis|nr:glycosyltransferase [Timaviella obliquedivisa GSE-PSE-MK23-08B]
MISVITPVYNGDRFIESCIHVVLDQACLDIEHLIIDGGSSDRTVEIIQRYAAQYSHIRWISEKDQGQSDAMNKGINLAKGEIIAMLNVDDYYEPNVLNQVLKLFQTLPEPTLLVGNCHVWDDAEQLMGINRPKHLKLTDLLLGQNINPFPLNPSAYFYHRSLHEKIGCYLVDDHYSMDVDFLFRAVQVAHLEYVDQVWGNYRLISGTKTFIDCANGHNALRIQQLMKQYQQQIPTWERSLFEVKYFFCKILARLQYVSQQVKKNSPSSKRN